MFSSLSWSHFSNQHKKQTDIHVIATSPKEKNQRLHTLLILLMHQFVLVRLNNCISFDHKDWKRESKKSIKALISMKLCCAFVVDSPLILREMMITTVQKTLMMMNETWDYKIISNDILLLLLLLCC